MHLHTLHIPKATTVRYLKTSGESKPERSGTEMETGRAVQPVGLPVGSRFVDQPVKTVEKNDRILLSGN